MSKNLIQIASEIVQIQVSSAPMTAADITSSLRLVFNTLLELQRAETAGTDIGLSQTAPDITPEGITVPKLTPEDSIQDDKVICLECGAEFKQLTQKHLIFHGMGPKEYKKKYGFTMRTPLAAKSLIKARSKAAKKRGLPEKLQQFIEARRQEKVEAPAQAAIEPVATARPRQTKLRKKKA